MTKRRKPLNHGNWWQLVKANAALFSVLLPSSRQDKKPQFTWSWLHYSDLLKIFINYEEFVSFRVGGEKKGKKSRKNASIYGHIWHDLFVGWWTKDELHFVNNEQTNALSTSTARKRCFCQCYQRIGKCRNVLELRWWTTRYAKKSIQSTFIHYYLQTHTYTYTRHNFPTYFT